MRYLIVRYGCEIEMFTIVNHVTRETIFSILNLRALSE